jgi:hypothetical protein
MATYVNNLRLTELATGEGSGSWGTTTNSNLEFIGEALGFGTQNCFASDANATTTVADGASDPARSFYFKVTSGATLSTTRVLTIAPNTLNRVMFIENATTGSQTITIKQGSGATVNIASGALKAVYLDGAGSGAAVADALVDLDLTGTTTMAALNTSGAITSSGVITGTTVEATATTSAGDNAAIGYTSANGLMITGQGSTNDVTIQNDAAADVIEIPTGTVKAVIAGLVEISAGDIAIKNGGTQSTIKFYCEQSNAHYAQIQAPAHSAFSGNVTLTLPASTDTLAGIAATQTLTNKTLTTPILNSPDITGGTAAGDDAALGYTSALGLVLTGQGSSNDVTIKNDADAAVLTVPTGTTNVSVVGDLAVGGSITDSGAAVKVAGLETIYVPASAMYPETTNGCSDLEQVELSNGPELKCLDFAAGADDFAQFQVIFPKSWNEGTVTFQAFFTVTGTNTGTVAWGLAGRSFADSADLNTAFGTQVVATAKAHSGTSNDIDVAAVSGAVTIAGAAADTLTIFQIARDVSADSQTGAARLLGIKLFFTTDAANDA